MPRIHLPTQLRPHAGGSSALDVPGATVGEVLTNLVAAHPELRERVYDGTEVRRFLNLYLNDEDVRFLDDLDTAVGDSDVVALIPNVAGG